MDFNFSMPAPGISSQSSRPPPHSSLTFKADALLGGGLRGSAWRFQELRDGKVVGRFVVKYAKHPVAMPTIEKEIRIIQRLRGHAHIAQPILDRGKMRSIPPSAHPVDVPQGTSVYVVTEYLKNGSLDRFLQRARRRADPIPNLLRMVIGMARPSTTTTSTTSSSATPSFFGGGGVPPPSTTTIEQLPLFEPTTGSHYQIYHGDLQNLLNLMFGDLDASEHALVPILKAIDFGESEDDFAAFQASCLPSGVTAATLTQGNIRDIGVVMQMAISYVAEPRAAFLAQRPNLDPELYDLVTACAAADHRRRPTLARLHARVQDAVARKNGPAAFAGRPHAARESDAAIREYLREVLYSADTTATATAT
ncbi:hypothetical protein F5X96DRAFT_690080 [Biscogniauxia mediterranea]|nr:hypothetical protein F5X96DRAFT_690080 [Biscogniauxia mediterranea]